MNYKQLNGKDDIRISAIWRILIFLFSFLALSAPLILLNNSILQFLGADIFLITLLFVNSKFLDKIPFSEYGFHLSSNFSRHLLAGITIGFFSVSFILGIGSVFGVISYSGYSDDLDFNILLLFGIKMLLVAILEEGLFRGYLFTSIYDAFRSNKKFRYGALYIAIGTSSVLFGLAHFDNNGASIASIGLLTFNGIVWCIPFVLTKNLGLSIGLHASWNFAQSLFGFTMSGNKAVNSLFKIDNIGGEIWTGGNYGPEAGLLGVFGYVTMLTISILFVRIINSSK